MAKKIKIKDADLASNAPIIETAEVVELVTTKDATPKTEVATVTTKQPFLSEDGTVNLNALTPKQIDRCKEITKNLSAKQIGSVQSFGIEAQSRLSNSSKNFINSARTTRSGEVGVILASLTKELNKINPKDLKEPNSFMKLLAHVPIVNNFIPNIKNTLVKYQTIEESIQSIEENIKASQLSCISDNNKLQIMFDDNVAYIRNIEDLLVAGTMALEEAKGEFNKMVQEGADSIAVSDQQAFIESLDKRLGDLNSARQVAKNGLMEIRLLQRNNITLTDTANAMVSLTVPLIRHQMSLAVAIANQNDNIAVQKAVREKTNELLKANTEALYHNSVETAKAASESIVSADVIRESSEKIKQTIIEIQKVQNDVAKKRHEEQKKLAEIEHDIDTIMQGAASYQVDSATKGISLLD